MSTTAYEIGKSYRVTAAIGKVLDVKGLYPLIGPLHDDAEHLNFPRSHWHVDWRFVRPYTYGELLDSRRTYKWLTLEQALLAWVIYESNVVGPIQSRVMKCRRQFPAYPLLPPNKKRENFAALEAAYADKRIGPNMVCPHKGADLSSVEPVDGCVTCPLHGLTWNLATGRCVRRYDLPTPTPSQETP